MSARQLIQSLPDIVRDSRLETEFFSAYTQHIVYVSGYSARERHVPKEERWVRDRLLGRGACGTVSLERCEQRDGTTKLRAVKQIKKSKVAGKELYMRELEAISKFSHKRYSHCFVRSDGWFENSESVFIAMEYFDKGDLHKYLTKPLPEPEARGITLQVLEGLRYMHENEFVHRDLKPGNIMVVTTGPEWFVKIADFGISKRRQQYITNPPTVPMGTPGFAAPETMGLNLGNESESYAAAIDMWSLGACAFMILSNSVPFLNMGKLFKYATGKLSFPLQGLQSQSVTDHGQQFILALMSSDPAARLSSEEANKHPWITTNLSAQLGDIKPRDTMLSVASAAWSSIAEQTGQQTEKLIEADTEKKIEESAKGKTVVRLEERGNTYLSPFHRPPHIDGYDDKFEEASRVLLPPNSPYGFDNADSHSPAVPKNLPSHQSRKLLPEPNSGSPATPFESIALRLAIPEDPSTPELIEVEGYAQERINQSSSHGRSVMQKAAEKASKPEQRDKSKSRTGSSSGKENKKRRPRGSRPEYVAPVAKSSIISSPSSPSHRFNETSEDIIRRLILPEIDAVERQRSQREAQENKDRDPLLNLTSAASCEEISGAIKKKSANTTPQGRYTIRQCYADGNNQSYYGGIPEEDNNSDPPLMEVGKGYLMNYTDIYSQIDQADPSERPVPHKPRVNKPYSTGQQRFVDICQKIFF